jgi:enterochelin esterase-like enzyme
MAIFAIAALTLAAGLPGSGARAEGPSISALPPASAAAAASARSAERAGPKTGAWSWKGPRTHHEHWVQVPENYDPATPCPVFVCSFGDMSSGEGNLKSEVCAAAHERGWIVIAPTWKREDPDSEDTDRQTVADEATELLKLVMKTYNVDKRFIVSSGYAGGGSVAAQSFIKYTEIYTHLVSQSGAFFNFYVFNEIAARGALSLTAAKRPVLVVWGEEDGSARGDCAVTIKELKKKGYTLTSYMVPERKLRPAPEQVWAWLDVLVAQTQTAELAAALKTVSQKKGPEAVKMLAPFQQLRTLKEKKFGGNVDQFVSDWNEQYNQLAQSLNETMAKSKALFEASVEIGRQQLANVKFNPAQRAEMVSWVRSFKTRWSGSPELCRAADEAYEKAYGLKLPEEKKTN